MAEVLTITETLVKASSLDQFRLPNGKRRLNMPYWVNIKPKDEEPVLFFNFIREDTDVQQLVEFINQGKVFIQEKYLGTD